METTGFTVDITCLAFCVHPPALPEFLEGKQTACFVHHCTYTQHAEQCPGPSLHKSTVRTGSGMKLALHG